MSILANMNYLTATPEMLLLFLLCGIMVIDLFAGEDERIERARQARARGRTHRRERPPSRPGARR